MKFCLAKLDIFQAIAFAVWLNYYLVCGSDRKKIAGKYFFEKSETVKISVHCLLILVTL